MEKTIFSPPYRRLIARLREARLKRNLTQAEVCRRLGRSRTWLQKVESCELRLDALCLSRLVELYGVDIRAVFDGLDSDD